MRKRLSHHSMSSPSYSSRIKSETSRKAMSVSMDIKKPLIGIGVPLKGSSALAVVRYALHLLLHVSNAIDSPLSFAAIIRAINHLCIKEGQKLSHDKMMYYAVTELGSVDLSQFRVGDTEANTLSNTVCPVIKLMP